MKYATASSSCCSCPLYRVEKVDSESDAVLHSVVKGGTIEQKVIVHEI
jgi:hypothetical protein